MGTWNKDYVVITLPDAANGGNDESSHTVYFQPCDQTYPTGRVAGNQLGNLASYKPASDLDTEKSYFVYVDDVKKYRILGLEAGWEFHIGPFQFTSGASFAAANGYAYPTTLNGTMYAPVVFPYQLGGQTLVLDQITIYYYTDASGDDFDFALLRTDRDGTITIDEDEDNIGNGETGNSSKTCLAADLTLSDYAYWIEIDENNCNTETDVRIYDILFAGHFA